MDSKLIFTALLAYGCLLAAPADTVKNGSREQPILNYNIPLWADGKVPLAAGN
jgi:hypothetical protein